MVLKLSKRRHEELSSSLGARRRFESVNYCTLQTLKPMNPRQQRHHTFPQEHDSAPTSPRQRFQPLPGLPPGPLSLPEPVFGVPKRTDSAPSEGTLYGFTLKSETTLRTWRTERVIQKGQFGMVMLAVEVTEPAGRGGANAVAPPPVYFAVKEIRMDILNQKREQRTTLEDPLREVSVMQHMGIPHPNVIQCIEALRDNDCMYIISPFYNGGELFDIWQKRWQFPEDGFTEDEAHSIFFQVVDALLHLKNRGICHRDVSLENLVMHDGIVKLIDAGAALRIPQTADGRARVLPPQGPCGKPRYMAPEVFLDEGLFDGFAADVWSLGVLLFDLATGRAPFESPVPSLDTRCKVIAVEGRLGELVKAWNMSLSQKTINLIQSCLRIDPANRAPLETLRNHRWVTG